VVYITICFFGQGVEVTDLGLPRPALHKAQRSAMSHEVLRSKKSYIMSRTFEFHKVSKLRNRPYKNTTTGVLRRSITSHIAGLLLFTITNNTVTEILLLADCLGWRHRKALWR
jgi:hypothetical protein